MTAGAWLDEDEIAKLRRDLALALRTVGVKTEALHRMGLQVAGLHEQIVLKERAIRLRNAQILALRSGEPLDAEDVELPTIDLDERNHPMGRVIGALKACINDHGPITSQWLRSAAKRVLAELRVHNRFAQISEQVAHPNKQKDHR